MKHSLLYSVSLAAIMLAGVPVLSHAEDITYDNHIGMLRSDPLFAVAASLFPSDLSDNSVTVVNGEIAGLVLGGISENNDTVSGNTVTIGNETGVPGQFVLVGAGTSGGVSVGDVTGNSVTIHEGTVNGSIAGGFSVAYGTVSNNSVTINDGNLSFNDPDIDAVSGGYSAGGDSTGNSVTIFGGVLEIEVYGGSGDNGNVTDNRVTISGGTMGYNVIGGGGGNDNTGNSVTISGTPQFSSANSSLYGGFSGSGDIFTGNSLDFSAHPISVNTVANFESYTFTIDPALANKDTALISAQTITLGNGSGTPSTVVVVGVHPGQALQAADTFILMKADDLNGEGVGETSHGIAQQGISLIYDIRTDVDMDNNQVTATILPDEPVEPVGPARVNPQLRALSEGRLSGLMQVTRGADAIANNLNRTIHDQNRIGLVPFIMLTASHNRYDSGSHIETDDLLLTTGLSYRQADFTIAAFAEAGWGNYDSYNSFADAADVHGDGDNHYLGGGLFGHYSFANGLHAEASWRAGRSRSTFDTRDIVNLATGELTRYRLTSSYMSAHAGAGYLWSLSDSNSLDISAKYLWSRLGGKDAFINGDPLHFDTINSQRLRLEGELRHHYSDNLTLFAGLGYEYEFDAEAPATAYDIYRIDAPKLKGSTGILSFGATLTPTLNRNLTVDLRAQGYLGKREGGAATVRVNYAF